MWWGMQYVPAVLAVPAVLWTAASKGASFDVPTVLAAPAVASSVGSKGSAVDVPAELAVPALVASIAGKVTLCNVEASYDAFSSIHHEQSDSVDDSDASDMVAASDLRQQCLEIRIDKRQRSWANTYMSKCIAVTYDSILLQIRQYQLRVTVDGMLQRYKFPVCLWHLQITDSLAVLMSTHVNRNWLCYRPWTQPLKLIASFAKRFLRSSRSGSATPLAANVLAGKLCERPILATDFDEHWHSIAWSLVNCDIHLLYHKLKTFIALVVRPKQELTERVVRQHSGMMHYGNRLHVNHSQYQLEPNSYYYYLVRDKAMYVLAIFTSNYTNSTSRCTIK